MLPVTRWRAENWPNYAGKSASTGSSTSTARATARTSTALSGVTEAVSGVSFQLSEKKVAET